MIGSLQSMVTRRFDVFDPVVLTVGSIHGGTRSNIIPDTVEFQATIRTFSTATAEAVGPAALAVCQGVAMAHGLEVDAQHLPEYPATVNDPGQVDFAAGVVADVFGADRYEPMEFPQPGSEDFSRVLQAVPGTYLMLGAAVDDPETAPSNHSPRARFDDRVLTAGAVLHAELATRALADLATAGTGVG
jgi:hippurate hydrolase